MYIRGFLKGFLVLLNHIEREILSFVVSCLNPKGDSVELNRGVQSSWFLILR